MKHKWAKEIKAWADGAEIQFRIIGQDNWYDFNDDDVFVSVFDNGAKEFRIKPQPKEPQYLYVYQLGFEYRFSSEKKNEMQFSAGMAMYNCKYIGKIKLEQDDE